MAFLCPPLAPARSQWTQQIFDGCPLVEFMFFLRFVQMHEIQQDSDPRRPVDEYVFPDEHPDNIASGLATELGNSSPCSHRINIDGVELLPRRLLFLARFLRYSDVRAM
jgi:hypothetical protein